MKKIGASVCLTLFLLAGCEKDWHFGPTPKKEAEEKIHFGPTPSSEEQTSAENCCGE
jgi:hypothetical protein